MPIDPTRKSLGEDQAGHTCASQIGGEKHKNLSSHYDSRANQEVECAGISWCGIQVDPLIMREREILNVFLK